MRIISPELYAYKSGYIGNSADSEASTELDFNLARNAAIMINRITGFLYMGGGTLTGFDEEAACVQELDLDPDNTECIDPDPLDAVTDLDSSRVFRQIIFRHFDTATGSIQPFNTRHQLDWYDRPHIERPLSNTNLRHHVSTEGDIVANVLAEIQIAYQIVELSRDEVGGLYLNRR